MIENVEGLQVKVKLICHVTDGSEAREAEG